ncbi:MAG TPA: protease complex subunit PrcB family protein [Myxococcaceae bacterium]|nr:protease complex subunit PrcB family protein [Myxococcaceae bacterium]
MHSGARVGSPPPAAAPRNPGLGTPLSGGYAVDIPEVVAEGDVPRIEVVETRPGEGCVTTAALTRPVVVVAVARGDWVVSFRDVVHTVGCGP